MKKGEVVDEKSILTRTLVRKRQKLHNLTHSDTDKGGDVVIRFVPLWKWLLREEGVFS
jgi:hypothetical protein